MYCSERERSKSLERDTPYERTDLEDTSAQWTTSQSAKRMPSNLKSDISLKKRILPLLPGDGEVLRSYCFNGILIIVQVKKVHFWKLSNDNWIQVGMFPRENDYRGSVIVGIHGEKVTVEGEMGVLYAELWSKMILTDKTRIMASCFYWNPGLNCSKHNFFELETVDGCIEDVKLCIIPDFSLYVCVSTTSAEYYHGNVKKYSIDTDLKGVRSMKEVMFTIWPLTYWRCVSEKNGTIVGYHSTLMMLWNYKDDYVWSTFRLDDPCNDSCLGNSILHWITEKQGFLYAVFEKVNKLVLVVLNIKSTAMKIVSEFIFPHTFEKLLGVTIDDRILVALFKNGIIRWNIQLGDYISVTPLTNVKKAFLGMEHAVLVKNETTSHLEIISFE